MRASAAAAPEAMPINASSTPIRVQNAREPRSSRCIRPMRSPRYQAPSTPIAMSATTLTIRIAPYGDISCCHVPIDESARARPDPATMTKPTSAIDE